MHDNLPVDDDSIFIFLMYPCIQNASEIFCHLFDVFCQSLLLLLLAWHPVTYKRLTLPETNSSHLQIGLPKRKGSFPNHHFQGRLLLVSGSVHPRKLTWIPKMMVWKR